MIIGHRTKPDDNRTVVFRVAFLGTDKDIDSFEMSIEDAEIAIASQFKWEFTLRRSIESSDNDD